MEDAAPTIEQATREALERRGFVDSTCAFDLSGTDEDQAEAICKTIQAVLTKVEQYERELSVSDKLKQVLAKDTEEGRVLLEKAVAVCEAQARQIKALESSLQHSKSMGTELSERLYNEKTRSQDVANRLKTEITNEIRSRDIQRSKMQDKLQELTRNGSTDSSKKMLADSVTTATLSSTVSSSSTSSSSAFSSPTDKTQKLPHLTGDQLNEELALQNFQLSLNCDTLSKLNGSLARNCKHLEDEMRKIKDALSLATFSRDNNCVLNSVVRYENDDIPSVIQQVAGLIHSPKFVPVAMLHVKEAQIEALTEKLLQVSAEHESKKKTSVCGKRRKSAIIVKRHDSVRMPNIKDMMKRRTLSKHYTEPNVTTPPESPESQQHGLPHEESEKGQPTLLDARGQDLLAHVKSPVDNDYISCRASYVKLDDVNFTDIDDSDESDNNPDELQTNYELDQDLSVPMQRQLTMNAYDPTLQEPFLGSSGIYNEPSYKINSNSYNNQQHMLRAESHMYPKLDAQAHASPVIGNAQSSGSPRHHYRNIVQDMLPVGGKQFEATPTITPTRDFNNSPVLRSASNNSTPELAQKGFSGGISKYMGMDPPLPMDIVAPPRRFPRRSPIVSPACSDKSSSQVSLLHHHEELLIESLPRKLHTIGSPMGSSRSSSRESTRSPIMRDAQPASNMSERSKIAYHVENLEFPQAPLTLSGRSSPIHSGNHTPIGSPAKHSIGLSPARKNESLMSQKPSETAQSVNSSFSMSNMPDFSELGGEGKTGKLLNDSYAKFLNDAVQKSMGVPVIPLPRLPSETPPTPPTPPPKENIKLIKTARKNGPTTSGKGRHTNDSKQSQGGEEEYQNSETATKIVQEESNSERPKVPPKESSKHRRPANFKSSIPKRSEKRLLTDDDHEKLRQHRLHKETSAERLRRHEKQAELRVQQKRHELKRREDKEHGHSKDPKSTQLRRREKLDRANLKLPSRHRRPSSERSRERSSSRRREHSRRKRIQSSSDTRPESRRKYKEESKEFVLREVTLSRGDLTPEKFHDWATGSDLKNINPPPFGDTRLLERSTDRNREHGFGDGGRKLSSKEPGSAKHATTKQYHR